MDDREVLTALTECANVIRGQLASLPEIAGGCSRTGDTMPVRKDLTPEFRRALDKAFAQREAAEARFRAEVLRGLDNGEQIAAMAREIGIDRRLLWQWVRSWTHQEEAIRGNHDEG